jgi:hypothetical protein
MWQAFVWIALIIAAILLGPSILVIIGAFIIVFFSYVSEALSQLRKRIYEIIRRIFDTDDKLVQ